MVKPRGNWQPVKEFDGVQIYLDPDTGQFGAHLGKTNDTWMGRKDLKVIEREIRKRQGGISVIATRDHKAWQAELTGYEKDHWLFADGGKDHRWYLNVYRFDGDLLADLQVITDEFAALREREKLLQEKWSATLQQHKAIRESELPTLLAEARARKSEEPTEE
jgi:hypothetical protein